MNITHDKDVITQYVKNEFVQFQVGKDLNCWSRGRFTYVLIHLIFCTGAGLGLRSGFNRASPVKTVLT